MQPYVIAQGDFLLQLAHRFGFDADTVWQDPSNADLRNQRTDPNILLPGDVLQIPDQSGQPSPATLTTGSTNTFVSDPPPMTLTINFVGSDATAFASKAYTIQELDQLTGLVTDANGVATFQVPVTLETATVVFSDTGESYELSIGAMDPINSPSGIFKRLQNLGYINGSAQFDASNLDVLRAGLVAFKAAQQPSSDDSSPASTPPSDAPPASSPPASSSSPNSTPPASGSSPDSALASGPASGAAAAGSSAAGSSSASAAPDSAPASSPSSGPSSASDDAGLADDGTLDAPTTALLLQAHGC